MGSVRQCLVHGSYSQLWDAWVEEAGDGTGAESGEGEGGEVDKGGAGFCGACFVSVWFFLDAVKLGLGGELTGEGVCRILFTRRIIQMYFARKGDAEGEFFTAPHHLHT